MHSECLLFKVNYRVSIVLSHISFYACTEESVNDIKINIIKYSILLKIHIYKRHALTTLLLSREKQMVAHLPLNFSFISISDEILCVCVSSNDNRIT